MVDSDIIEEWMYKADQDFEFARINLEEEKQVFAQICFHFNQSAEKYLKSFIIANKLEFRKIHDLHLLLKQCKSKDPSLSQIEDDCEYLATFYIETRYPVHWPAPFQKMKQKKHIDQLIIFVKALRENYNSILDPELLNL